MNISYNGHRIKVRLVRTRADRINVTFRSIVPGFEDGIGAAEEANACVARMGLTCEKR